MNPILIVVDMQNDFITGSLGSAHAEAIVENVCKKIADWQGDILYTLDTHEEATYMQTTEGKSLPVMHCVRSTEGWMLHPRVQSALEAKLGAPLPASVCFEKACFGSPELAKAVAENATSATLIGLCTDVCVISNAVLLRNQHPHMVITVDAACCAGVTMDSHKTALRAMQACGISVINDD